MRTTAKFHFSLAAYFSNDLRFNACESSGLFEELDSEDYLGLTGKSKLRDTEDCDSLCSIIVKFSGDSTIFNMSGWIKPDGGLRTGLRVLNSLTGSIEEFLTHSGDRKVSWYMCGPTVYSDAHMGHARTYISFDVLRRIMTDYFGYSVTLCVNITDIDDKIIVKSREEGRDWLEFAQFYENRYFEDMAALNVKPPDVLTRVSEYVPEITVYILKIIENGFAYESNGSVYFDTTAFGQNHNYGKLEPTSVSDMEKIKEAEGALTDTFSSEKKTPGDFALWKKSKQGEPAWESPWGPGRPGWHIECSVMASDVLPCPIDIHSGGVDLRFPHHDNELAQSEAFFDCPQWINYFLHTGHLHIKGCKMARSLKNFITIRELLKTHSGNQLRMMFLLHKWDGLMNYSENSTGEAVNKEKQFREFFLNANVKFRALGLAAPQKFTETEKELARALNCAQGAVHNALSDNFDTKTVIHEISNLINRANSYIQGDRVVCSLLRQLTEYVAFILKCLGMEYTQTDNSQSSFLNVTDALVSFRDQVKTAAKRHEFQEILAACDQVRDQLLPPLGIRIEDVPNEPTIWKQDDPQVILKEILRKQQESEEKLKGKQKLLDERAKRQDEKEAMAKIHPQDLFTGQTEKYSQFDPKGVPTHDAQGKELSKSLRKKLLKEHEKQVNLYEAN